jgi:alpha-beta hydrolase superfamily lysophospholipase
MADGAPAGRPSHLSPSTSEIEAHKRAMSLQRLLDSGMEYADAIELYRRVEDGEAWHEAGTAIGDRNVARATQALTAGRFLTARSWFLHASACYLFAQVPLEDADPAKRVIYERVIDAYGRAGELFDPPFEHVEIPYATGRLCGWLIRPSPEPVPVVVVIGGYDSWREKYHRGAAYLVERGLAVFLLDAPGQGESRLFHQLYMAAGAETAISAVIDHLLWDARLADMVGLLGHSLGGYLVASAAAGDGRVGACCVNGGTVRPGEILRYRRVITKLQLLLGLDDPAQVQSAIDGFKLEDGVLRRIRCPLLVVHGTPDRVFLVDNARPIYQHASSTDKTWIEFPDGDHCVYNHAHERNTLISDWFVDRLVGGLPTTADAEAGSDRRGGERDAG